MGKRKVAKKKDTLQKSSHEKHNSQLSAWKEPQPTSQNNPVLKNVSKRKSAAPRKRVVFTEFMVLGKKFKMIDKILEEVGCCQATTRFLIPRLPFARLVKEIFLDRGAQDLKIQDLALQALQEATEMHVSDFLEDSNMCVVHAKRIALFPLDMPLAKKIRKE